MIEAAREFVESGKPPRRSVLFIANTGEENGLLGADYFAAHPTVPISRSSAWSISTCRCCSTISPTSSLSAPTIRRLPGRSPRRRSRWGSAVSPDPMPEEIDLRPLRPLSVREARRAGDLPVDRLCQWRASSIGTSGCRTIYHSLKDDLSQPINWKAGRALRPAQLSDLARAGRRRPAAAVVRRAIISATPSRRGSRGRSADP